jgi:endoglucanase
MMQIAAATAADERADRGSGLTRRRLLAAGAVGAAVTFVGCERPRRAPEAPGATHGRSYMRGVNSYTLNYLSHGDRVEGEPRSSYAYLAERGHSLVRLPFQWGSVQPLLGAPLDQAFLGAIEDEVAAIGDAGMQVVLDVHSGGRHPTMRDATVHFGEGISPEEFVDVWLRLSERFAGDRRVHAYDLMNEPHAMPNELWQRFSQSAVAALRKRGDRTLLWIEGNDYSLAGSWRENQPAPWIDDPLHRHVYSAHTYPGAAGMEPQKRPGAEDETIFLGALGSFVDWLHEFGCRGSIGEVGWPSERQIGRDAARAWNRLGDAWYARADEAGLDVTYFGASCAYDNWLWAYDAPLNGVHLPGISRAESQAAVLETHPTRKRPPDSS